MLKVHCTDEKSPEVDAAQKLAKLACEYFPELVESNQIWLEVFPSVQCFGERVRDIDLLILFSDYRDSARLYQTESSRKRVHSFAATIELKGHNPDSVSFQGPSCFVEYRGKIHDVTAQSEAQKYSVKSFLERNLKNLNPPYISNLIWLSRVSHNDLPSVDHNMIGMDVTWAGILDSVARQNNNHLIQTFSHRSYFRQVSDVFGKRLMPSKLDRKKLEVVTRRILDRSRQQYADRLDEQLLIFRGRGGTGKTIRLIQLAHQVYSERGWRILFLTYNKALVADLTRIMSILKVRGGTGRSDLSIRTIHSFMYSWLMALKLISKGQSDFLEAYEDHKNDALALLSGGAISSMDIEQARSHDSRSLTWDLILIDEAQDWPENERDLIYKLYGARRVVLADGVDQFVRGVERIDWRDGVVGDSQVVTLHRSLRLKASLCNVVNRFAEQLELNEWKLEPEPEAHGGKIVVVAGAWDSKVLHGRIAATAADQGNKPVDLLLCVPPSWVENGVGGTRRSRVALKYESWGRKVWDGVDPDQRGDHATDLEQYRIVQYESCRGLEGWAVICFALDEFYELKKKTAEISELERSDMWFDEETAAEEYAKRWLMIPLTRAIDTLVIHITDEESYVGQALAELRNRYPTEIDWVNV